MLKHPRDLQSVIYLLLQTASFIYLWFNGFNGFNGFNAFVYAMCLFLTLGVGVIHHNHAHLPLWRSQRLNRATDLWLTVLQGHPTFVFYAAHNNNHHRYSHGEKDVARTYRFTGDNNHFLGYLLHPLQAAWVLYPVFLSWLKRSHIRGNNLWKYALLQYALVLVFWVVLAGENLEQWFLFILIPQLHGLHWLLATNYLQHAHADGNSRIDFARNFHGLVNPFLFNIGLHTAHHLHPRAHWSDLKQLDTLYRYTVHPSLNTGGLLAYMLRTYLGGLFFKRFRSHTLMKHSSEKI